MCLRLLNWPVQRQQRQRLADDASRLAIHTVVDATASSRRRKTTEAEADLRFVRELFPSAKGGPAIVCASDDAWAAGVRPGMPLAEARSMVAESLPRPAGQPPKPTAARILRESAAGFRRSQGQTDARSASAAPVARAVPVTQTTFREWSPAEDRDELVCVAELTRRFAPVVGLEQTPVPDSLLLDITGCGPLFGGEACLAEQLIRRLTAERYRCRAAISDSVATAWAFAHAQGHFLQTGPRAVAGRRRGRSVSTGADAEWETPVVIIPPGQAESWLHPLPVAAARIPLRDTELLRQLGILTIQQLLGLPVPDLPSRLSDQAIERVRQLQGLLEESIVPIPEADPVSATWVSEFAATNRREVAQVLQHLVDEVAEQLQRRYLGAVQLSCQLKQEDNTTIPLTAETVKPVQAADALMEILKLRLEGLNLPKPIFSVTMTAAVAPLPVARQKDLFSTSEHVEPVEELTAVINRLSNRLGKNTVLTVHPEDNPVPEQSVTLRPLVDSQKDVSRMEDKLHDLVSAETATESPCGPANRPLRLLPVPRALATTGQQPLTNGFFWDGQAQNVQDCRGPERIQTRWWDDSAVHRDYYRVRTTTGAEFWIFQDLTTREWLLHGIFE